jgi:pyruvate dehydrogenase E1 component alpha subunit
MTYRIGAHTTSDDPTKYRDEDELAFWQAHDPIDRFRSYLKGLGVEQGFFDSVDTEAEDFAADIRKRTLTLENPPTADIFAHVFTEDHPVVADQAAWLENYLSSFEQGTS